ncbi:putative O-Antigen ligase [Candidatus Termititenax persephonae]|uniref:O-Antigen ligase n=1 Tax=Candidatus Termititenax persephonae TaxID=2218525 RepID=A0A388TFS1_9BACT|nr:putative O-Antigen ligase [Candidatus Termititenax persephonae]
MLNAGLYILQIAVCLMLVIDFLYWKYSGVKDFWDKLLGLAFLNIAVGTPIIFTSLTRSVFEVSKLLNVRLALIWVAAIILLRAIIKQEKLHFSKTALNWPILAFVVVNLFSAFWSSNHYIAILGAYDRWEGLITELNYLLLIFFYINYVRDSRTIFWILGALIFGTIASSIYGVFQAMQLDFMRWSVDPTARVFACINNPVHFAPYVVMHIPLIIGVVFYFIRKYKLSFAGTARNTERLAVGGFAIQRQVLGWGLLLLGILAIFLIHLTGNYYSFGRATWIGFSLSITLCLALLLGRDQKAIGQDLLFVGYGCFLFNAGEVFKIWTLHVFLKYFLILALAVYLVYILYHVCTRQNWLKLLMYSVVVLYGGYMQFASVDLRAVCISAAVLILLGLWIYRNFPNNLERVFLLSVLTMLTAVVVLPSFSNLYYAQVIKNTLAKQGVKNLNDPQHASLILSEVGRLQAEKKISAQASNVFFRTQTYAEAFNKGTARTSMWKTGAQMWQDAPLVGQGPGMIKEMYPKYRREDYGRLEGGQHYTPDKLHNDYVNMLATRGALGFAVYYLWLLPVGFFIMLRQIWRKGFTPGNYILLGLFSGLFVYLGQVLFNFGVVATRVIFYEFFCLAICIALYNPFDEAETATCTA